jgi:hypothetical protein
MTSAYFHTRIANFFFIADMYRAMFKFEVFNAMQSSCFDTVGKQALSAGVCNIYTYHRS